MSAFIGRVFLGLDDAGPLPGPLRLSDQTGLGAAKELRNGRAAFTHCQRTITPQDRFESQPLLIRAGTGVLLFDGRLDDRAGLFQELGMAPQNDMPDSVLVGHAFEKWGEDAPMHLVGVFALAMLDQFQHRLLLSTDPLGSRTLYFHRQRDSVTFSTVLPALLQTPGIPRELDDAVLSALLMNDYRDSRASFFRGIQRVLGGETVVCSPGNERMLDHWPLHAVKQLRLRDDNEYVAAAREVLDSSVQNCMRSIRPLPLLCSGGLDSSCLVVAGLAVNHGAELPAITLIPEPGVTTLARSGRYISEQARMETMQSAFPRLSLNFVEPDRFPDMMFAPENVFDVAPYPTRAVLSAGWSDAACKRVQELGASAYLMGGGGNFTFTWDGVRGLDTSFRRGQWLRLGREAAALGRYKLRATAGYIWREALRPNLRHCGPSTHNAGQRHQFWLKNWVTTNRALLSEFGAAVRARYGLESRFPLLDIRLIRFCMSIPEDQFLRNGQTRWLARRVLRQAGVPAQIAESTDRGANCPEWFTIMNRRKDTMPAEIASLQQSALACRLIDVNRLQHIVAHWPVDAIAAQALRTDLEIVLTRALHVGAFIQWAEAKDWSGTQTRASVGETAA